MGLDVQDPVDPAVAGAGQAVAFVFAAGGVQRRGAVPGREPGSAGEAGHVGDVAEQSGGGDRAEPRPCRNAK
jgi:hypothetical protein